MGALFLTTKVDLASRHRVRLKLILIFSIDAKEMQKNIANTIFYSLLFAMGGAPTIAMIIINAQTSNPEIVFQALIGLSVIIACILVPIILIQNTYLIVKRHSNQIEQRIQPVAHFYLALNVLCLIYWLVIQFS